MNYIRWAFNIKQWIPTQDEWQRACMCVQKEELENIHRFVYCEDAKASMVGRLLMRKAVSESTDIPYNQIRFSRTERGKPFLCNTKDMPEKHQYGFNVSHHGDFSVVAVQDVENVGIDVMKVTYRSDKPLHEYFELMKKQFSSSEWEYLTQPGFEKQKLERFYRLWCLKESYVKATGIGISKNLRDISFHCPTINISLNSVVSDTQVFIDGHLEADWRFEETFLDENHVVAVALRGAQEIERFKTVEYNCKFVHLNFEGLMKNSIPFEDLNHNYWKVFSSKESKLH